MLLQPHHLYGWEMNALQALRLLRRLGQVSRQDARQMRSLMRPGTADEAIPPHLWPACNLLYLLEVAPANRLPA